MRRSVAGPAQPSTVKPANDAPANPPALPSPEMTVRRLRRLDWLLVGVVLLFAFLTALFPVYNSDFFLHAATGRLLAHGEYSFGADPFAFTTAGVAWVNHSWLYDLLIYLIYQSSAAGGTILIVLKALMIAALAEVMFARPVRRAAACGYPPPASASRCWRSVPVFSCSRSAFLLLPRPDVLAARPAATDGRPAAGPSWRTG